MLDSDESWHLRKMPKAARQRELNKFLMQLSPPESYNTSQVIRVLSQLMCSKTFAFSFDKIKKLYKLNPSFENEILKLVSARAKNIEIIYGEKYDREITAKAHPLLLSTISKLRKLRVLEICSFHFLLVDLMHLCRELSSLKAVRVQIAPQPLESMKTPHFQAAFKKSFRQLSHFRFRGDDEFQRFLTFYCIHNLPRLQVVGDPDFFSGYPSACWSLKEKSNVQHLDLTLSSPYDDIVPSKQFRRLKSLTVKWEPDFKYRFDDQSHLSPLLRFKKLNTLKFIDLNSVVYLWTFLSYGKNLKSLTIEVSKDRCCHEMMVSLKMILEMCPKLETLTALNVRKFDFDQHWFKFLSSSVKELTLSLRPREPGNPELPLSDILLQPCLESVRLAGFEVSRKELELTTNLVRAGKILTKLKDLHLSLAGPRNFHYRNATRLEGRNLVAELRSWHPEAFVSVEIT